MIGQFDSVRIDPLPPTAPVFIDDHFAGTTFEERLVPVRPRELVGQRQRSHLLQCQQRHPADLPLHRRPYLHRLPHPHACSLTGAAAGEASDSCKQEPDTAPWQTGYNLFLRSDGRLRLNASATDGGDATNLANVSTTVDPTNYFSGSTSQWKS